jgi:hypothetical protein
VQKRAKFYDARRWKVLFLVVANRTQSRQSENWSASFLLRPNCDNLHAWSTLGVRKIQVLRKFDRRACNADKTYSNSRVFSPLGRTYYARGSYFPLALSIRVNKWGMKALPLCVLPTFKVHGEYYYRTCEVRHTQTTHVSSTIKVCQKYAHNVGKLMNPHKNSGWVS